MAKRIYVGGLPYSATESDLENLFSASGTVTSVAVVTDRYTGQAKGFGFVEMETDEQATAAINALNGKYLLNFSIFGGIKGRLTGRPPLTEAGRTVLVGALASGAAYTLARLISG